MTSRNVPNLIRSLALGVSVTSILLGAACAPADDSPEVGRQAAAVTFDWGSDCSAGSGEFTDAIPYRATKIIGDIPVGKRNVSIMLDSGVDVDVQLIDKASGAEIIAWPNGLLSGAGQACTTYKGVEYCYSGYDGIDGRKGRETIEVKGDTNIELVMKAYGYVAGDARVTYSWQPVPTCNETGDGSFSAYLPQSDVQLIGDVPVGKVNVLIALRADQDLDIQLFDGDRALVRWPDGDLNGSGEQALDYQGMRITWSGYNGDGTGLGHEFIRIDGRVASTLTMKAFAYRAGTAQVTYEWGRGAGAVCGGRTNPPNPPCGDALQCKDTIPGGSTFDAPGECHTESWCASDELAGENCKGLAHTAVPGAWGCVEFECTWQPGAGGPEAVEVELPPGMSFCGASGCGVPVELHVCPDADPSCDPATSAAIEWTINGKAFDKLALLIKPPAGNKVTIQSGPADWYSGFVRVQGRSSVQLDSATPDLRVLHYDVQPTLGGLTTLEYSATGLRTSGGTSFFFRFSGYDPKLDHAAFHSRLDATTAQLTSAAGVQAVSYRAFMLPTELAVMLGGEGNFSYGNGTITTNYGNPAYIENRGGAEGILAHHLSHEYVHELFRSIRTSFTGNSSCLNEGMADALGSYAGDVPADDLGPVGNRGADFRLGCGAASGLHEKGNCVMWHVKDAGYFSNALFSGLFHPQRTFAFDSCNLSTEASGNGYVVYLSEAAGTDLSAVVTAAGIPHAGSYQAALAALGL